MTSVKQLYLTCILCREAGTIKYPSTVSIDHLIGNTQSSAVHVCPAICEGCADERKNESAIEYFNIHKVALSYVESTLVYHEAILSNRNDVIIPSINGLCVPVHVYLLMNYLKDTCIVYSMEYDDGRLFTSPMEPYFFGNQYV